MNSESLREIYRPTVHAVLTWSDTCWNRRIWRTDTFWFY